MHLNPILTDAICKGIKGDIIFSVLKNIRS